MESQVILLDTGVLIEFFRKKDKSKSYLFKLSDQYSNFAVSAITKYEVMVGSTADQQEFWNGFFGTVEVIPFDEGCCSSAVLIYKSLKLKNKLIGIEDLLIGATALANDFELATLNRQHFERIKELKLIGK